jgi:hypothetical protein
MQTYGDIDFLIADVFCPGFGLADKRLSERRLGYRRRKERRLERR